MVSFNARIRTSASFAVIAFAGLSAPAYAAQATTPVTQSEADACAKLPTQPERDLCIQGQAKEEGTIDQSGEQSTIAPEDTAATQADTGTIVVTGSRIRTSPFSSPDPITVIDPDLEEKAGEADTAEILQTSPIAAGSFQITSVLSAGSFVTNGGVGAQTLSLRGLGAERTLILVNGRRAGPSGTRGAVGAFDLNVIPASLIESVEILKTGASSIYGSDAIAGVVNLLTKKKTDGLEMRGFVSAPFDSGGESYNVSAAYGKQFSRGHIIGGLDYYRRNDLRRGDRDYLMCAEEYLFNRDGDRLEILDPRTGEPRCNTLQANFVALGTTRTISPGVTYSNIQFNNPGDRLNEFLPPVVNTGTFGVPTGFFPIAIACSGTNPAAIPSFPLCRNALALLNQQVPLQARADVFPDLKRYTAWLDGSFDITDNVQLVGELLYNKRQTHTDGVRQLFFTQFTGLTGLPASQCTAARRALNPHCSPTGTGDPTNAGFYGNFFITPVIPIATSVDTDIDYYRAVGGVKADLGGMLDGWRFDSYLQFSRSDGDYTNSRVFLDAIETQEFRSRSCLPGEVTRVRGVPCMDVDFTDPRVLAGDFNAAERDFLFGEETGNTKYDQLTGEASLAGNLFHLPAGPVGVAVGVQYRRDEIDDTPGEIVQSNNVWGQSVAGRTAGFTRSQEAFGEVSIPLIHNTRFIQSLDLSAAARLTNNYAERHDGVHDSDKGNWTYKLGFNWQTTNWLRFRGTYGTSYRAPALFEQFLADQTGFQGQAAIDPCIRWQERVDQGSLSPVIGERCEALGIPGDYTAAGSSSAVVAQGGGIGVLEPETSKAKTLSVIFTPDRGLWDGMKFSVAVDYFDIDVSGEITTLGAANILFSCFDSDNYPNDPTCGLFERDLDSTSSRYLQIISVRDPFININRQRNRGVDLTARLSQDLGSMGTFGALAQMTWQIEDLFILFQGEKEEFEGEIGEPKWVGDFRFNWDKGPWGVFYGLNVIGGVSSEEVLRNQRGDVCFRSAIRGGDICPIYKFKPQFYHTASVTREIGERFSMTLGVNNIFDTKPPRTSGSFGPVSTIGQTSIFATQYDLIGRRAFIAVRAKM
jgi:iron complex outermembrane receptor protein